MACFTFLKKEHINGQRCVRRPVCQIKGGTYDKKKVYLDESGNASDGFKKLVISDGHVQHIPNDKTERECLYISGPSGSGKSTYLANFCKLYKKRWPNNNLVLISPICDDEKINILNPIKVKLDKKNFTMDGERITLEELADSLVIFDDIDAIPNRKIKSAVQDLRNDILLTGRHFRITQLCTSHMLCNYVDTRILLNEAHYVTMFPRGGNTYQCRNFMKTYCGFDKAQTMKVFKLPSRWVTIHKHYPVYVMSDSEIYIDYDPEMEWGTSKLFPPSKPPPTAKLNTIPSSLEKQGDSGIAIEEPEGMPEIPLS